MHHPRLKKPTKPLRSSVLSERKDPPQFNELMPLYGTTGDVAVLPVAPPVPVAEVASIGAESVHPANNEAISNINVTAIRTFAEVIKLNTSITFALYKYFICITPALRNQQSPRPHKAESFQPTALRSWWRSAHIGRCRSRVTTLSAPRQ